MNDTHWYYTATSIKRIFLKRFLNQLVSSIALSGAVVHVCGLINEHIKKKSKLFTNCMISKDYQILTTHDKNNVSITRNQFIMRVYSGLSYGKLLFRMERNYLCQHIKKWHSFISTTKTVKRRPDWGYHCVYYIIIVGNESSYNCHSYTHTVNQPLMSPD